MLVLNANREQEIFFNELLKITESQVVWDGNFVIMGDRLILEGYVRSLIFHFDIQKAEVDLIDLPDDEDNELEMDAYPGVPDLIALAVYAFESWGLLNGLDIKEDVSELNKRFNNILSAYHFTVTFDKDSIQFYKDGIPVTYEDVIEAAVTSEALPDAWLKLPEFEYYNDQNDTPPVSQAAAASSFAQQSNHDSAASAGRNSQEVAERIEKYHSRIGVLDRLSELQIKSLRRDISWDQLLTDQEKEELLYPVDDYLEQKAAEAKGGGKEADPSGRNSQEVAERIEKYHSRIGVLDRLSELQIKSLRRDISWDQLLTDQEKEELLYPVDDYLEQKAAEAKGGGKEADPSGRNSQEVAERIEKYHSRIGVLDRLSELQIKSLRRDISWDQLLTDREKEELLYPVDDYLEQKAGGETGGVTNAPSPADARDEAAVAERIEKYHTRIGVLDRLSSLQKKALRRDITYDRLLTDQEKEELLYPVNDFEYQEKMAVIDEALKDSANRNYAYIRRTMKLVVREDLADNIKTAVTDKLGELAAQYARQEVRAIMEQTPQYVERAGYQELMEQLAPYEEADLAPFQDRLRQMRESLEIKEISNLLAQSQKKTRKDFTDLLRQITEGNYAAESAAPYIENILDWVRDIDKDTLEKLVGNVPAMNFDQALSLYERIDRGSFLPDLKAAALERLSRRLQKIRMEECGKLAYILHKNLANVIKEYAGHHFCPLEKTVRPEELKILDNALSSYAKKRELFEYPIIVVDTSKEGNGQEGMLITPENLFYGTKGNGYKVPVRGIRSIQVSSGLLGHRLVMDTTGGVRYRLPYIVDTEELPAWAGVLGKFVRYLQNTSAPVKPLVRSADDQDVVSCRQCGCVYQKDMERCPECGYTAG